MALVYIETSFVSACVGDREDVASIYRRQASNNWWASQQQKHDVFISEEVLVELSNPGFRHRDVALELVRAVPLLPIDDDVRGLARILVREQVMPSPSSSGDAIHVATATVHGIEYMVTWNVRHLANANKLEHLRVVCRRVGYIPPAIVTSDLLWEYEE